MSEPTGQPEVNKIEDLQFYKDMKSELDPYINGLFSLGAENIKRKQFQKCIKDWNQRVLKILPTYGTVNSLEKLTIISTKEDGFLICEPRLQSVVGLFRYLGFAESLGAQLIDLAILLLVANGYHFHVEREHEVPRIIHASKLIDLRNVSLGTKIKFLERCELKQTANLIDKDLRNSIAHLNFTINEKGIIRANSQGKKREIDIHQKIKDLNTKIIIFFLIFNEIQDAFLEAEKRLTVRVNKK